MFRFFLDGEEALRDDLRPGVAITLSKDEAKHARVVRLSAGDTIEVGVGDGRVFLAEWDGRTGAKLGDQLGEPGVPHATIHLICGMLTSSAWDTMLDGAVQAGVTMITPLVATVGERAAAERKHGRGERIIRAAAKQAKRSFLPTIQPPMTLSQLVTKWDHPSIVLVEPAVASHKHEATLIDALARAVTACSREGEVMEVSLLIGPSDGWSSSEVGQLCESGWIPALLGSTVMRSETAATVAVGTAQQVLCTAT